MLQRDVSRVVNLNPWIVVLYSNCHIYLSRFIFGTKTLYCTDIHTLLFVPC